jgi:hypothetical protein
MIAIINCERQWLERSRRHPLLAVCLSRAAAVDLPTMPEAQACFCRPDDDRSAARAPALVEVALARVR